MISSVCLASDMVETVGDSERSTLLNGESGQNTSGQQGKPKSASQLRKEASKAEKLAKFREKERKLNEMKAQQVQKSEVVF